MRLLLLGGTVFVGRHIAEAAVTAGHEVTLFHRGRRGARLFPQVARILGDRDGELDRLRGGRWDAVIDTCGYVPRVVRASAELLAGVVEHYAFISSISVYDDVTRPGVDETAPVGRVADETVEEVTGETYGPLKALCERAVERILPGRTLIVRPGLVAGPHDPTDRFTYWPRRVARGGEVLAPRGPRMRVQLIDARDLARWVLRMVEGRCSGTFNAVGPRRPLPMGEFLETCRAVTGAEVRFVWVADAFLVAHGVTPFTEMPLWIPHAELLADASRALAAGLDFRPLEETIRDTLAWDGARGDVPLRAGLDGRREVELLRRWREDSR